MITTTKRPLIIRTVITAALTLAVGAGLIGIGDPGPRQRTGHKPESVRRS